MKAVYPVIITPSDDFYVVNVPDLDIGTQGIDLPDAIAMARDAIGLWGICQEDLGNPIPVPSVGLLHGTDTNDIVTLVDIDFDEYRRANDNRSVRKNVTIPGWLEYRSEKAGVNYSKVLTDALVDLLGVTFKKSKPE